MHSPRQVDQIFLDTINNNLLTQMVTEPTRGPNILDLVFAGNPGAVLNCYVDEPFSTSDHNVVFLEVDCAVPRITRAPRKVYLYSRGDYEAFNQQIVDDDWSFIRLTRDMEVIWCQFKSKLDNLMDTHIPFKYVKPGARNKVPWSRYRSVTRSKKKKRTSRIRSKVSGLAADRLLHKAEVDAHEHVINQAKSHYEDRLVDQIKDNPKFFWNYTRHFTRSCYI